MPALLWLLLSGCLYNAVGRWEIVAINIGESSVADAGFLDMAGQEADRISEENAVLLRYSYQPADGTFVPDPTPEVFAATTDAEDLLKGETTLNLSFPLTIGEAAPTTMVLVAESGGRMVVEDTAFLGGTGMSWLLSRSDTLEDDPDVPDDL